MVDQRRSIGRNENFALEFVFTQHTFRILLHHHRCHHHNLGCAFRPVFRFIPVLIFRNSGFSAEFPDSGGTHIGIKSFQHSQGKINLLRNSGPGIPDPEFRREGPLTWCILCHV
jgi:hypothetical protein